MALLVLSKRPGIMVTAATAVSRSRSALHPPPSWRLSSSYNSGSGGQLPQRASVVVCGGGVIGTSVAYHLSKAGVSDVVLLESGSFSCGSTWHAAGLMGIPLGGNTLMTKYRHDTIKLIPELEKDSGCDTGFKQCGSLMVAHERNRLTALHHQHNFSKIVGVESHLLNPQECLDKFPLLNVDDVLAGLWVPEEGTLSPSDLCQAYVKGARALGAVLLERMPVVGVQLSNYFVAAGLNSLGISSSGGLERALAQWVVLGHEPMDMWSVDMQRFSPHAGNPQFLLERVSEAVETHYMMPYPRKEFSSGRGLRTPPLYHELDRAGALWRQRMGWEVPLWFATEGQERERIDTFGKPNRFGNVETEHAAACNNVALLDLSSFAKFEVEGQRVAESLQKLYCSDMDVPSGCVLRTGMLNDRGCLHTLCWVVRVNTNKYFITNVPELETRDHTWMQDHLPSSVRLSNVTAHYATLALVGPKATELLGKLTHTSLQEADFPLSTAKLVDVGTAANVILVHGTSLGQDNGWELHVPSESAASVHRSLVEAGKDLGLCHAGMHALDSLRLEAGQLQWGRDISAMDTPYDAGLSHLVCHEGVDFIGREALAYRRRKGVQQRVCLLEMEGGADVEVWPYASEPVLRNGQVVGSTQSVAFGFRRGYHLVTVLLFPRDQDQNGLSEEFCSGEFSVMVGEKTYKATLKKGHLS